MPKRKSKLLDEKEEKGDKGEKILDPDLLLDDDGSPIVDSIDEMEDDEDGDEELMSDDEVDPFKDKWEE